MNRREIIIVAALINAGLLIALFVTGIKKEDQSSLAHSRQKENIPFDKTQEGEISSLPKKIELPPPLLQEKEELAHTLEKAAKPLVEQEGEKTVVPVATLQKEPPYQPLKSLLPPLIERKKETEEQKVVVGKGDVLEKIARQHQVTVKDIMALNRLTNTRLQIGQVLLLPPPMQKQRQEEKKEEERGEYYTVKSGDSPWTIAHKNQLPIEELLRLNGMDEEKAKKLKPGDRLRIK